MESPDRSHKHRKQSDRSGKIVILEWQQTPFDGKRLWGFCPWMGSREDRRRLSGVSKLSVSLKSKTRKLLLSINLC